MAAFAAALLLPALAVAVPSPSASTGAGAGAEESAEALRRLQAAGACNGMMLEMQPIAASCCGSNMEYCQGPVPSRCDDECKPVFESFFSRCNALVTRDANAREFSAFQGMCHPASADTSETLFEDDFEGGLSKWRGQSGDTPETAIIGDDPGGKGGHVLQVRVTSSLSN